MGSSGGAEQSVSDEDQHRLDFQNGRIDYAGIDSFENIHPDLVHTHLCLENKFDLTAAGQYH